MLGRSGVGFNHDGDYKIDCSDEQWEQIVAADKDAKGMRTKSWPLWETWKVIFGKDRASGEGVHNVAVAAERIRSQLDGGSQVNENDYTPSLDDIHAGMSPPDCPVPDILENNSGNSDKEVSTNKRSAAKGKKDTTDAVLMEFLSNLHAETNARLDLIASRIGYEIDMGKARQDAYDKLGTVDGLSIPERYVLCNIMGDKPQRLEVFMGMPPEARLGYVRMLIEENRASV